jgi:hypothetical protein
MASLKDKIAYNSNELTSGKKTPWLHIPKGARFLSRKKRRCEVIDQRENGSIQKFKLKIIADDNLEGMTWDWVIGSDDVMWEPPEEVAAL